MPNGAILFIARNCLPLTKAAVRSALAQDVPCDILVIDNNSSDGTGPWLRSKSELAVSVYTDQKSLSTCWNNGIRTFWSIGAERVLVCNVDIELRPDTYRLLASHGGPFVTCVSVNSRDQMGNVGDRSVEVLRGSERPHPDFSAFMISKVATDRVGWFDESYYPAYYEDNDMHVRMHRAGIKAVCVDLPFLHHAAQTIKTASPGEVERIKRGAELNKQRFKMTYGCVPGTPEYEKLFL